eukprot:CAMPEP_0203671094 /NCGR_PEP_ID=MMETSP0090-20130426/6993_1 /ASSEMBLY_ACC=CAM_ASM_001088 /TAXON_ID=426623 /ORGANISM="Chaetoceros affinis, Strain CCMP159" /LENGTH=247 /DNA_ID=CAMNT_0050536105 /DNA_START=207 /DNA_END=950 /DNA_ORIENTATION=+
MDSDKAPSTQENNRSSSSSSSSSSKDKKVDCNKEIAESKKTHGYSIETEELGNVPCSSATATVTVFAGGEERTKQYLDQSNSNRTSPSVVTRIERQAKATKYTSNEAVIGTTTSNAHPGISMSQASGTPDLSGMVRKSSRKRKRSSWTASEDEYLIISVLDEQQSMEEKESNESDYEPTNKSDGECHHKGKSVDDNKGQSVDDSYSEEEEEEWELIDWESVSRVVESRSAVECLKRYLKLRNLPRKA